MVASVEDSGDEVLGLEDAATSRADVRVSMSCSMSAPFVRFQNAKT
jgi:hypothetical protein